MGAHVIVVRQHGEYPPYYEAKWRIERRQTKRRLGPAWVDRASEGSWAKRRGRVPEGFLDERAATVLAAQFAEASAVEAAEGRERASRITFREVAHEWLNWLEQVKGASPATVRDYTCLLHEPGRPHKRGTGKSPGRIMAAFGDTSWRERRTRSGIDGRIAESERIIQEADAGLDALAGAHEIADGLDQAWLEKHGPHAARLLALRDELHIRDGAVRDAGRTVEALQRDPLPAPELELTRDIGLDMGM